jgi:hypothetical protein
LLNFLVHEYTFRSEFPPKISWRNLTENLLSSGSGSGSRTGSRRFQKSDQDPVKIVRFRNTGSQVTHLQEKCDMYALLSAQDTDCLSFLVRKSGLYNTFYWYPVRCNPKSNFSFSAVSSPIAQKDTYRPFIQ